jgi:histidinol-phosphate/aromatic aminotransferase/cobyric acid decarboxylase-like protein
VGFPLGDWIDDHDEVPHNLGHSGMRDQLTTVREILGRPPQAAPDAQRLRQRLAEHLNVPVERLFLTHGATEANSWGLFYLARTIRSEQSRVPVVRIPRPEYPSLVETAQLAEFVPSIGPEADLYARSEPNNPTGRQIGRRALGTEAGSARRWFVDETFREFGTGPSLAASGSPGLWATGTFTKAFGADRIRVGWIVPPPEEVAGFRRFYDRVTDKVPWASVSYALDLLEQADTVLAETREMMARHRGILEAALPELAGTVGPVAFDRPGPDDTRPLALAALQAGVLVCPGDFFGDGAGVRLGLCRTTFPKAFPAYFEMRRKFART